jgi:hypothetical protein
MVNDHIPKQDRLAAVCNSRSVVYIDCVVRADMETELVLEHRFSFAAVLEYLTAEVLELAGQRRP